jgi:hypothetical protein
MAIQEGLRWLANFGLLDVILPFILVFTIMFGTLDRIKLFVENGKPKRNINAMLAFCVAFMAVVVANVLTWVNALVTAFAITSVFMLLIILVSGLAGAELGKKNTLVTGLTLFIFILSSLAALTAFGIIDGATLLNAILWPLIGFIALGITAYFIFRKPSSGGTPPSNPPPVSR